MFNEIFRKIRDGEDPSIEINQLIERLEPYSDSSSPGRNFTKLNEFELAKLARDIYCEQRISAAIVVLRALKSRYKG